MKKRYLFLALLILSLSGCGSITNDDLIGGTWHPTKGYVDGEISGEPDCPLFERGIQFIDDEKLNIIGVDVMYEYKIEKRKSQVFLYLYDPSTSTISGYPLPIKKISKDEIVIGTEEDSSRSCLIERQ